MLFMLSGEPSAIPETEARTLVRDLDPEARFEGLGEGLLAAETSVDPSLLERRVAFSRRVGLLVPDGELDEEHLSSLRQGTYRVRVFGDASREEERSTIAAIAGKVGGRVSLEDPDWEVSVYVSAAEGKTHLALTRPGLMRQGWSKRRPRSRAFFHPSAIFPKLSRALVNLSGVQPGEAFVDPFCGTGSLLIEASLVGAEPLGVDVAKKMVRGARRNSLKYLQPWLGVVRADSRRLPIQGVSAISTDIPYGRASSAGGLASSVLLDSLVEEAEGLLPRGRKLVVMHPKSLQLDRRGMNVESELDIYIHRTLTRRITVLRRTR